MGTRVNAAELANRDVTERLPERGGRGEGADSPRPQERRVISKGVASLIVGTAGAFLLGLGALLLAWAPYPGLIVGEERLVMRFFGIAASTTGAVALCAATLLAASSLAVNAGGKLRVAAGAILLGVIAAFLLLD